MKLGFSASFPFIQNKNSKKYKQAQAAKSHQALEKSLQKSEDAYVKQHNQLADTIELRNKAQGQLITRGITVGTQNDSVQRVGLHMAQTNDTVAQAFDSQLEANGISPELGKAFLSGYSDTKAKSQGLPPEQYRHPTAGNYIATGAQTLKATPDVFNATRRHTRVLGSYVKFGHARQDLQEARTADLIDQHGSHLVYKKGHIVSGSYQAASPEELAAMLNKTEPASHISPSDVALPMPNATSLLPPAAPQKLPLTPSRSPENRPAESTTKRLSPKEATEKELAQREKRMTQLDADLRKEDAVALQNALEERDLAQVNTGVDVVKGMLQAPRESVMLGVDYLWKQAGAAPPFSKDSIQQAERTVGHAVGEQMGNGHAEKMLQEQVKLETLHTKGKATARELAGYYQEKAMETDRDMIVDEESGRKFYDAYDTAQAMDDADKRYRQTAREKLPRPEDALYLEDEITHFVPGFKEGIKRISRAWFPPDTTK